MNLTVAEIANKLTELLLRHPECAGYSVAVELQHAPGRADVDDVHTMDVQHDAGYVYMSNKPAKTMAEQIGWDLNLNKVIIVGGNAYAMQGTTIMVAPVFADSNQPDHSQWAEWENQDGVWADTVRQVIQYMPEM